MTGNKVYKEALALLGYTENNGNQQMTQRVMNRAVPTINLIFEDMRRIYDIEPKRITTLSEEIDIPDEAEQVFICGLASYIAAAEGDDNNQAIWSAEYQARRAALSKMTSIEDVIPTID